MSDRLERVLSDQLRESDLRADTLREVYLEVRALVDAAGHPCMMVNPEVVEQLAEARLQARMQEHLLVRQREAAENARRPRRIA
jgi:hypothetical protein